MSNSARADRERFEQELSYYKSLARANKRLLEQQSFLTVSLSFWIESVKFFIMNLEILEYRGDDAKYAETIRRINKAFYHINRIILYLDDESPEDDKNLDA